ncbi:MAG: rRNA biogenesis protein rrp5, partial [Oscillospiraceae bacterium]|nr:rRNA biogenesis protein rrp5 [Oscillospiraceae bacterium]
MNKVTAMLDAAVAVITDIRSLADSLQILVDAMSANSEEEKQPTKKAAPKKKATEEPKPEPQPEEEKPLTLEDVRAVCADKSRKGFT